MQLKWTRNINVHGRPGKNIPVDLHLEHLRRECKEAISALGANVTDNSINWVGKCIGRVRSTLQQYDMVNIVKQESGHYTCHSTEVDLRKPYVFDHQPGRIHLTLTANLVN